MKKIEIEVTEEEYVAIANKALQASMEVPEQLLRRFMRDLCNESHVDLEKEECVEWKARQSVKSWFGYITIKHRVEYTVFDYFAYFNYDQESAQEMIACNFDGAYEEYMEQENELLHCPKEDFKKIVERIATSAKQED